jgi:hypothetical protein
LSETVNGKSIVMGSFDAYCTIHQNIAAPKHNQLINLVSQYIPAIRIKYKWLFDNSITARYHNYYFDPSMAELALKYLESIKTECTATPPKASP